MINMKFRVEGKSVGKAGIGEGRERGRGVGLN